MAATAADNDDDDPSCLACVICLDSSGNVVKMPCGQCREKFVHADCLLPWLLRNGTCPTCRASLVTCNHEKIRIGSMEIARTPYIWPWIMLISSISTSFSVFSSHMNPRLGSLPSSPPTLSIHNQYRVTEPMRIFLDIAQYAVLITGVVHMVTYYGLHNQDATATIRRVSNGFVYWMLFVIFVALVPPFVFALSFITDTMLLLITYAVLIASTIPAMAMRSHQWRLCNVTTSLLFNCSTLAVERSGDVRLVLIMTLFGHYLSIATFLVAQYSESTDDETDETMPLS